MHKTRPWPWIESVLHEKQARLVIGGGVGCFLLLSLLAMVGERGFWEVFKYGRHFQRIESRIRTLEEENKLLRMQVTGLRSDPYQVEKLAREDLGLARPDEIISEIVDRSSQDISWPKDERKE
jgi:cell division protein FtsB